MVSAGSNAGAGFVTGLGLAFTCTTWALVTVFAAGAAPLLDEDPPSEEIATTAATARAITPPAISSTLRRGERGAVYVERRSGLGPTRERLPPEAAAAAAAVACCSARRVPPSCWRRGRTTDRAAAQRRSWAESRLPAGRLAAVSWRASTAAAAGQRSVEHWTAWPVVGDSGREGRSPQRRLQLLRPSPGPRGRGSAAGGVLAISGRPWEAPAAEADAPTAAASPWRGLRSRRGLASREPAANRAGRAAAVWLPGAVTAGRAAGPVGGGVGPLARAGPEGIGGTAAAGAAGGSPPPAGPGGGSGRRRATRVGAAGRQGIGGLTGRQDRGARGDGLSAGDARGGPRPGGSGRACTGAARGTAAPAPGSPARTAGHGRPPPC